MKRLSILVYLCFAVAVGASTFPSGAPSTTNNDDSCDVTLQPAATLLLPYFEVDLASPSSSAVSTIFTITNVTEIPRIAFVTVWTDWGVPILGFSVWLHGYDVQGFSMYDVIARGVVPPTQSAGTVGAWSESRFSNPNHNFNAVDNCAFLPGPLPAYLVAQMQSALTGGLYQDSSSGVVQRVGSINDNAVGYVTVDVVNDCDSVWPADDFYFSTKLLFDNVLIGDWIVVDPVANTAYGSPMVHIRAIPEGGAAGSPESGGEVNFLHTFYDRYTPVFDRTVDRRQPLPGLIAARFIDDASTGDETRFIVWREGPRSRSSITFNGSSNRPGNAIGLTDMVRFDESENPSVYSICQIAPCPPAPSTTSTGALDVASHEIFPPDFSGDPGGWIYLNLNNGGDNDYSFDRFPLNGASQNWVDVVFFSEGRYGQAHTALALGNGCSPNPGYSDPDFGPAIGPAPDVTP